jgi:hypothetical protein
MFDGNGFPSPGGEAALTLSATGIGVEFVKTACGELSIFEIESAWNKLVSPVIELSTLSEFDVAVHAQPAGAVTFTVPVPPFAGKFWLVGFIE